MTAFLNLGVLGAATLAGTILQIVMVVTGHRSAAIKKMFAVGGMGISLLAGAVYGLLAESSSAAAAGGAAIAGGLSALIGIYVSYRLKDVPASLMILGTVSSVATGALGGWLGILVSRLM